MPGIIVISMYLCELKVLSEFHLGKLLIFLVVVLLFIYLASKFSAIPKYLFST